MKFNDNAAKSDVLKLVSVAALSLFLVACSSGTTDDVLTGGSFDLPGGDNEDEGFNENDLDNNGILDSDEEDDDGNGIPNGDELSLCKGIGNENQIDESSSNYAWNDNCQLSQNITFMETNYRTPFYHSSYAEGIQRVLYCAGAAGVATSVSAFADGFFGEKTAEAVRTFQQNQNDENNGKGVLVVDGVVGPQTWARLQSLVEDAYISAEEIALNPYESYGVKPTAAATDAGIDCSSTKLFLGVLGDDPTALPSAWKLADVADDGSLVAKDFSIDPAN